MGWCESTGHHIRIEPMLRWEHSIHVLPFYNIKAQDP